MFAGTLGLGHLRPIWMELGYVMPAAGIGLLLGAILGLAFDLL